MCYCHTAQAGGGTPCTMHVLLPYSTSWRRYALHHACTITIQHKLAEVRPAPCMYYYHTAQAGGGTPCTMHVLLPYSTSWRRYALHHACAITIQHKLAEVRPAPCMCYYHTAQAGGGTPCTMHVLLPYSTSWRRYALHHACAIAIQHKLAEVRPAPCMCYYHTAQAGGGIPCTMHVLLPYSTSWRRYALHHACAITIQHKLAEVRPAPCMCYCHTAQAGGGTPCTMHVLLPYSTSWRRYALHHACAITIHHVCQHECRMIGTLLYPYPGTIPSPLSIHHPHPIPVLHTIPHPIPVLHTILTLSLSYTPSSPYPCSTHYPSPYPSPCPSPCPSLCPTHHPHPVPHTILTLSLTLSHTPSSPYPSPCPTHHPHLVPHPVPHTILTLFPHPVPHTILTLSLTLSHTPSSLYSLTLSHTPSSPCPSPCPTHHPHLVPHPVPHTILTLSLTLSHTPSSLYSLTLSHTPSSPYPSPCPTHHPHLIPHPVPHTILTLSLTLSHTPSSLYSLTLSHTPSSPCPSPCPTHHPHSIPSPCPTHHPHLVPHPVPHTILTLSLTLSHTPSSPCPSPCPTHHPHSIPSPCPTHHPHPIPSPCPTHHPHPMLVYLPPEATRRGES